jgi:ABC-2 type transport system ATP-binding protein
MQELFRLPGDTLTDQYSTGMKKKLLLLSQIKQDRKVFLMDEPFNGLDAETNRMLGIIFRKLAERGKTIFISSHVLGPLTACCDRIFHLDERKIKSTFEKSDFAEVEKALFGRMDEELRHGLDNL